jgi:hypothetical protein
MAKMGSKSCFRHFGFQSPRSVRLLNAKLRMSLRPLRTIALFAFSPLF